MRDLANKEELLAHLRQSGLFADKSFGQNFLIDHQVLDAIVKAAELTPEDHVVEVGPGPGVLSQRLAPHVKALTAVEIDEKMIRPWMKLMKGYQHAQVLNQDVLEYDVPRDTYKVVANIPYYITSPILKHFLRKQDKRRPELVVLMIQKEVAQRICDTKKPTLLSWEIRVFGEPEIICKVPPKSFYPSPKVDSAVLKIVLHDQPQIPEDDLEDFFSLLEKGYKQPRKTLMNNLMQSKPQSKEILLAYLEDQGLHDRIRPHELSLAEWQSLLTFWRGI